ncbi:MULTISPECIES: FAD-dependent oxidoreductase [unclassified Xanthobacter]|uniref:FAD-dependent oxidoreductase n=1 Tax=unclassified Xanthobacter TaxID=2623496 RepID=UPI001EE00F99
MGDLIVPFKIAVIGAGWYGCHIASSLASIGVEVVVFERNKRPLHEASGNNQFRLHLGFHYARHHGTRQQSRDGFLRFIERYPTLSRPIPENIYAVPKNDSLIDFMTYKLIMTSSGIDFVELPNGHPLLHNVGGAMQTPERVLLINTAREYFTRRLGSALVLDHEVQSIQNGDDDVEIDGVKFDYVIDCTWGHKTRVPMDTFYEPTILLYYDTKEKFPAITLVDGPLASIYPTESEGLYTLSSVPHTPLGIFTSSDGARECLKGVSADLVGQKRALMEEQISANVPGFRDAFEFMGIQLAIKTKLRGRSDDRSCYVFQDGRVFSVMSGKIDTIFFATERILSILEAEHSIDSIDVSHSLRHDIRS